MITKWSVANFKSIQERTELEFAPLTLFAGANSSGKSTFIQSMLLVAQTLASKVRSRSVILNGQLIRLGQFDDLKSDVGASRQIAIHFSCKSLSEDNELIGNDEISCHISFGADISGSQCELSQIQPRLFSTRLERVTEGDDNTNKKFFISVKLNSAKYLQETEQSHDDKEKNNYMYNGLLYDVELDDDSLKNLHEGSLSYKTFKPAGCVFEYFLPERIIGSVDPIEYYTKNIINNIYWLQEEPDTIVKNFVLNKEIVTALYMHFKKEEGFDQIFTDKRQQDLLFGTEAERLTFGIWRDRLQSLPKNARRLFGDALHGTRRPEFIDRIQVALRNSIPDLSTKHIVVEEGLPFSFDDVPAYLDEFFTSSLKYLGPLRDAPKPLYPLAPGVDPYDVGVRGEHTAFILELHKNKKIGYIPSANFKEPAIDRRPEIRTLEGAVVDWLQYLGVAGSVVSKDQGKLGHELKVAMPDSDAAHDLTHVGVGVSQVLPILVMCLLAGPDSTLIFEQPELHLHPKVQTLLGDFFFSMALCGKQCIVETHSEYLIDRLRFRMVAAPPERELNSLAKIYFVEKPGRSSVFREVKINEYGAITDWPEGFFDQSQQQAEAIIRAAMMKRKALGSKQDAQSVQRDD